MNYASIDQVANGYVLTVWRLTPYGGEDEPTQYVETDWAAAFRRLTEYFGESMGMPKIV